MLKVTGVVFAAALVLLPENGRAQQCPQGKGYLARYEDVMQKALKDREALCAHKEKTGKPIPSSVIAKISSCFQQLDPCMKKETPIAFDILKTCVYNPGILKGSGLCSRWTEVEACSEKAATANKEKYLDQTMKNAGMLGELFEKFELCVHKTVTTYK